MMTTTTVAAAGAGATTMTTAAGAGGTDDDDRRWRGREWRGYYDRGSNCYYVRRRIIDRDGDVIIRRSRVCED